MRSCSIAEDVDEIIGRLGSLEAEDQFIQRGWFTTYLVFLCFPRDVWLPRTCHSEMCKCLGSQWFRSGYNILNNGNRNTFFSCCNEPYHLSYFFAVKKYPHWTRADWIVYIVWMDLVREEQQEELSRCEQETAEVYKNLEELSERTKQLYQLKTEREALISKSMGGKAEACQVVGFIKNNKWLHSSP